MEVKEIKESKKKEGEKDEKGVLLSLILKKSLNRFFCEMFNNMNTLTETRAPDPIQASSVPSMTRKP